MDACPEPLPQTGVRPAVPVACAKPPMGVVTFDIDEIVDESRKAAGLDDFGPLDFRPGLEALAATYEGGRFNERGRVRSLRRLVQLLTTRLRMQAAWNAHPEILERPIRRPTVLTGMPRSGTSALFNLLGCDPAARAAAVGEAVPRPDPARARPVGSAPQRPRVRLRERSPDS